MLEFSVGNASADTSGDFQYALINGGTAVEITKYTGSGGNVTIPSSIAGEPVTMIGDNAFYSSYHLTGVTIPNSVSYVGNMSFNSCIRLVDLTIPSSVTHIGNGAFGYLYALPSVTVPSSVTSIGTYAFSNGAMTSATINSKILSDDMFASCSKLASVTFGGGLDSIGNLSFYGSGLTTITIPNTVTYIGAEAFSDCHSLMIGVDPGNLDFASANGVLYNKNMTTLIACPSAAGVFTIANGTQILGNYAFEGVKASSVTIPSSVTTIGNSVFLACYGLTSVTMGSGVATIGASAFEYCSSMTNMTFLGLTAPSIPYPDSWIYSVNGLIGHAYATSNFPIPGKPWVGLTMGSYVSTTPVTPGAPTGLQAKGGPGYIFLNWTSPSNVGTPPLAQYAIYRGTSPGGYGSPLSSFDSNTSTYNDTTATPGTQYYYVIKGVNTAGSSAASNEVTAEATTSAQSVPDAPTNLQATSHDGYDILTWNAPVNTGNPSFTEYGVWRGATADSLVLRDYAFASALTYNDTNVINGQTYVYAVKAMNSFGSSAASNTATATPSSGGSGPTPQAPSAPQNLVTVNGNNSVTLSWSAPANAGSPSFTRYDIYRGATEGSMGTTPIGNVTAGTLTYVDPTAANNNTYVYVVKAVNTVGSSSASNTAQGSPSISATSISGTTSDNSSVVIGLVVVIVLVVVVGLFIFVRRRKNTPPK